MDYDSLAQFPTFGKCGSCKFWGKKPGEDYGYCRKARWYSEKPLIVIENPQHGPTDREKSQLLFHATFGCPNWESAIA